MDGQSPTLEDPYLFVELALQMYVVEPNDPLRNWVDSRPLTAFGRLKMLLTGGESFDAKLALGP